jgi:serine/threonine protein kinase/tetratricopeptide (TPR) repeat protein
MLLAACPILDELRQFLDEQLELSRQAEIGAHVDTCRSCQTTLEELIEVESSDLPGARHGVPTQCSRVGRRSAAAPPSRSDGLPSEGVAAEGRDLAGEHNGVTHSTEESLHSENEAETSARLDSQSARLDDGMTTDFLAGEKQSHCESTDPEQLAGPAPGLQAKRSEATSGLPEMASYDLLDLLGEGGMGVVYRAWQRGLNRLVAVKMIRGAGLGRSDHLARIRIEAEAVARLHHPNIIQIHEIGEAGGAPFICLELLEGGSLDDRLAGTPQPGKDAAGLLITLARAVHVAHDAGIVHRDLKPTNVLFSKDGTPKLTDFGLAKRLESDSRQTESGQIMGSPSYMAPEQARGHTRDVGPAADVYALGAILYEMLTGRPPFKGETPVETVRQVVEDEVVPPSRLVPRVARDLETICLQCLHKEPSRRYGSAQALADDLDRFLTGRPIAARRTPLWERGVKLARRHPMAASLITLGVVATLALTAAWLKYSSWQTRRRTELTSRNTRLLFKAEDFVTKERWGDAEPILTAIQAEIRGEPELLDLARLTADVLARAQQGKSAAETRSRYREKLGTFRERRRDALLLEARFTDLDLPHDQETLGTRARAALAVFAAPGPDESWELERLPTSFSPREHEEIEEGCYELLLILAEVERSPDLGLRLLDQAGRLRPPTRAFHLRRADCLARRGDAPAAQAERERAENLPLVSALDHYLTGKELYKHGDWAGALPHFDAALLKQPGHFWAHCLLAISSMQLDRPVPARSELTACLQAEPGLAWLYELRGFASWKIAALARTAAESMQARDRTLRTEIKLQLDAAEADYATAIQLLDAAPNKELRYPLLVNRGLLWLERGEWEKAVADFRAAIELDDRRWLAFDSLGHVYLRRKMPDQAIEQFTLAINRRPDSANLYRARAVANLDRKALTPAQRAQAAADLEQAIRLEPPGSPLRAADLTRQARLLQQEGREEAALAACALALKINPGHLDAHRLRVDVYRKLNRYADLLRSCNDLLSRDKPSARIYDLRGLARAILGDYQGAIEDQTLAIALQPGSAPLLARRGAHYLVARAPQLALRDFQAAIKLDDSDPDAYLGRGLALVALGQRREAVADAAKALGMSEPTAARLYSAARIHALASIAEAAEVRKTGQEAARSATRNQDQAVKLLGEWLKRLPPAERSSSLNSLLEDPAMATLRRRLRSL